VFAGLIDAARLSAARTLSVEAPPSFAMATAVLIVPQVPCEWTFARTVVAPPMREPTS